MAADDSKASSTAYEINAKDYHDAQEVSLGKVDAIHANKYQEPKNSSSNYGTKQVLQLTA
jgi:hypothetical protein